MSQQINLKELEKKAYRSTFQDGLFDLLLAIMMVGSAFSSLFMHFGIPRPLSSIIFPLLAVLIWFGGKKLITIPRMGHVKFGPKRQAAQKKLRIAVVFFVIVTWIALLLTVTRTVRIRQFEGLLGALIVDLLFLTVSLSVMAYFLDFDRLYVYAVLYGMAYPFAEFLFPYVGTPLDGIIAFGFTGGIGLVTGLVYLIKFLQKYPKINTSHYPSPVPEGFDDTQ